MNCSQCQELLAEYAIDALPAEIHSEVARHLATDCADCQALLEQLTEGWAALPAALAPVVPPQEFKSELLERVRADNASPIEGEASKAWAFSPVAEAEKIERATASQRKSWRTALFYVAASLLGAFCGYYFSQQSATQQSREQLAAQYRQQTQQFKQTFGNNEVSLSAFETTDNQTTVQGHFIWDRTANQLHVYALDLGEKPADTEFRVWVVSSEEEWTSIGVLTPHDDGVSSAVFDLSSLPTKFARAVITVEPIGGESAEQQSADQPRGPVRFSGVFQ